MLRVNQLNGFGAFQSAASGGTVVFDAAASQAFVGGTTDSWTHTPVGTPTAVAVGIYWYDGVTPVTGITYGGVAMTRQCFDADSTPDNVEIWGLANPLSGARTVQITVGGSGITNLYGVAGSISVTGSDTATCFSGSATANGNSNAPSVGCASAVGELVICCAGQDPGGALSVVTGTQRWNGASGGLDSGGSTEPGVAGTVTMTWSSSDSNPWCIAAASFKAA